MADVNSNININFNTAAALAQLRSLQAGLSRFHQSLAEGNLAAANAQKGLNAQLLQSIGATGKFSASQVKVAGSTLAFTSALEKNKLSLREYFRYTMAAATANTRVLGKAFAQEREIINRARRDRVKALQAQYIQMNKSNSGFMDAIRVMPKTLAMANGKFTELGTRIQYAAQRQQFLNQLLKQGSTQLLNFGKNTQWAGRQLMVGLTMPLVLFGSMAAKTFRELETEIVKFKRVYGDAFTNDAETDAAVENIRKLATEYTKYGVAVTKTVEMAATAAAAGFTGAGLTAQVETATKLAVLGQVEQQQALETTISLQTAFGLSSEELAKKIDFLNAVENQTLLSIEDLTIAIPKAAPVVKQLGGSVEDLAFFLTAMKEGGINASEGANALKSGLASLINPSDKAAKFMGNLGINIKGLVEANKGDIKGTVVGFARALDELDPLNRARAIEQMFGKFQFARLSTLFQNVTKDGSQASRAFDLAGSSIEELAILSEREMKKIEDSVGVKFQAAVEQFKQDIMPLGKVFLEALTPVVKFFGNLFEKFNGLSDQTKKVVAVIVGVVAGLGPVVLMTFGLVMNAIANGIKLFSKLRGGIARLNGQTSVMGAGFNYMTQEQIENAASSQQLHQTHTRLIEVFNVEATSVNALASSYNSLSTQMRAMASQNPALFAGGVGGAKRAVAKLPPVRKFRDGILTVPGPKGAGDIQPAMLAPGEAVIPAKTTEKYKGLISAIFKDQVPGFMAGRVPKVVAKVKGAKSEPLVIPHEERQSGAVFLGMPVSAAKAAQSREVLDRISDRVKSGRFGSVPPTDFGTKLKGFKGFSFPERGIGGVYRKPNGEIVVVKPTMDADTALAEERMTTITREIHEGLIAPKQTIRTMMDPTDPTGKRKFVVLESPYDPRIAAMDGEFSKTDMVKQLVASTLRGDKDLQKANVSGRIVADVGNSGVYDRASGFREFAKAMPSMEQQAMINLLGVKGGAKKFFAQQTSSIAASMTPAQYDAAIKTEIGQAIPKLERLIKSWSLMPEEQVVYNNMLQRLKDGAKVDWAQFQPIHARAGEGIVKAITGIDPGALSPEIREQVGKYVSGSGTQQQSMIDELSRSAKNALIARLAELDLQDPARASVARAAWEGGKALIPPSMKEQGFTSPRQSTFLNEISRMTPVTIDGVTRYVHDVDMERFLSNPDVEAPRLARTKEEVINKLLYRMGTIPKNGKYVASGRFKGKFANPKEFLTDLRVGGKASGSWKGNVKKEFRKPLTAAEKAYNFEYANQKYIKMMTAAGLTEAQARDELKAELSHTSKTGAPGRGPEKWLKGTGSFDSKIVNRYMNGTSRLNYLLDWNKKNGYSLIPKEGIDRYYQAAAFMSKGGHPTNAYEASLVALAADADLRAADEPRIATDRKTDYSREKLIAMRALLADKAGRGFYESATKYNFGAGNIKGLVLAKLGEYIYDKPKKTLEKITRKNSATAGPGVKADTGKQSDSRVVTESPGRSVVTKTQAGRLATGRGVVVLPGRDKGDPYAKLSPVARLKFDKFKEKHPELSESQLKDILRRRLKHEQDIIRSKEKEAAAARKAARRAELLPKQQAQEARRQTAEARKRYLEEQRRMELNRQQALHHDAAVKEGQRRELQAIKQKEKEAVKNRRMLRQQKVGVASGSMSMGLGMAGSALMMTGNMNAGMGLMGASVLAGLAPMFAKMGPIGWMTTAAITAGGALLMLEKANKSATEKTSRLADATSATTEKMKSVGVLTGKVGASEIYDRRRRGSGPNKYSKGFERGSQQFGTTFLESETGKSVMKSFTEDLANGGENAVKRIAIQLSAYVSDGVMTAEDAHSVASQIGMNLNNQTLITRISGTLLELIGPGGEDLLKNPLTVRLNLVAEQMSTASLTPDQIASAGVPVFDQTSANDDILAAASGFFDDYIALFSETPAEKIGASLGASFANSFEFNQAQMDSFAKYYDDQIAILEKQKLQTSELAKQKILTDQISELEDKRDAGLDDFRKNNKIILDNAGKAVGALQDSTPGTKALKAAAETQLLDKYKGTDEELLSVVLAEKTKQLDLDLQIKINAIGGSGIIGPEALGNMVDMFGTDFAGQAELRKELEIAITKQDPAEVEYLLQGLGVFEDKDLAKDVFVKLINKDPKTFTSLLSAFTLMQKMDGKEIDLETFFKGEDPLAKIEALQGKLDKVQAIDVPITKDIIGNIDLDDNLNTKDMEGLVEIWDKYANLPDETQKTIISSYITLMDTLTPGDIDAEIARRVAAAGGAGTVADYYSTEAGRSAAKQGLAQDRLMNAIKQDLLSSKGGNSLGDQFGPGNENPLSFLDSLAMGIKQVKDNAFNALKPVEALLAAFRDKKTQKGAFALFDGIQNRLLRFGAGEELRSAISSMSAQDFAKIAALKGDNALFTFAKGKPKTKDTITGLTDTGKAVDQGYKEVALGGLNFSNEETIKGIKDQTKAYNMLISSGVSAGEALDIVSNKAIAAAIASGAIKKGTPEWDKFIGNIKTSNTDLERQAVLNKAIRENEDFKMYKEMPKLASQMKEMGYSTDQIDQVLGDPQLAKFMMDDLKDGKLNATDIAEQLNNIEAKKLIDIQVQLNKGNLAEAAELGREIIDDLFAAQEGLIRTGTEALEIKTNDAEISDLEAQLNPFIKKIQGITEEINDLNRTLETSPIFGDRAIQAIEDENNVLSNDLTVISNAAEEVNKKYDEQAEALSKIQEINQGILEQQQSQLDLADALTSGDISAAARAVQAMRAASAARFASAQSDALQRARENEIGALKGPQSGLTQEQINKKQYENSQKIYAMENNPARLAIIKDIQKKQDEIYDIEEKSIEPIQTEIDKLVARNDELQRGIDIQIRNLTVFGQTRDAWDKVNSEIDYYAALQRAINNPEALAGVIEAAGRLKGQWADVIAKMDEYKKNMPDSVKTSLGLIQTGETQADADKARIAKEREDKEEADRRLAALALAVRKQSAGIALTDAEKELLAASQPKNRRRVNSGAFQTLASGGLVPGGFESGAYAKGTDTVPAMLTPGEYVLRKSAVDKYGVDNLDAMNVGYYDFGGLVKSIWNNRFVKSSRVGALSGGIYQTMEEIEKSLSLKHGSNQNSSGWAKWSRAFGRVAFNTLQHGLTGLPVGGWGGLLGVGTGLIDGVAGLIREGSDYGLKGGKYANKQGSKAVHRGFDPKKELDNMSIGQSVKDVGKSMGYGALFNVGGTAVGQGLKKFAPGILQSNLMTQVSSKLPKINSFTLPKLIANIKSKTGLQPSAWEKAYATATQQAQKGGFTPIESLLGAKHSTLLAELEALVPHSGTFFAPKSGIEYAFRFRPGPVGGFPTESRLIESIKSYAADPNSYSEKLGPQHLIEVTEIGTGKRVADLTWDSVTGSIGGAFTQKPYQDQGIMKWLNEYASSFSRLKHSSNRTPEGRAYSAAVGGIMPDKPFIDTPLPINLAIIEALKTSGLESIFEGGLRPRVTAPSPAQRAAGNEQWAAEMARAAAAAKAREVAAAAARQQSQDAIDARLSAWRTDPNRTYNSYPHFEDGLAYIDPTDLAELTRLQNKRFPGSPQFKAKGGIIPEKFVSGGYSSGTDTVPAMLTPGEYVLRKDAVKKYGVENLDAMNLGYYHKGGPVGHRHGRNAPATPATSEKSEGFFGRIASFFGKGDRGPTNGGPTNNSWLDRYARSRTESDKRTQAFMDKSPLTSWMPADYLGLTGFLKTITGQATTEDKFNGIFFPLNFLGVGKLFGQGAKTAAPAAKQTAGFLSKLGPMFSKSIAGPISRVSSSMFGSIKSAGSKIIAPIKELFLPAANPNFNIKNSFLEGLQRGAPRMGFAQDPAAIKAINKKMEPLVAKLNAAGYVQTSPGGTFMLKGTHSIPYSPANAIEEGHPLFDTMVAISRLELELMAKSTKPAKNFGYYASVAGSLVKKAKDKIQEILPVRQMASPILPGQISEKSLQIGKLLDASTSDGVVTGINETFKATLDGVAGFYKTRLDFAEVQREIFGSIFARAAGLIAPKNIPVIRKGKDVADGIFSPDVAAQGAQTLRALKTQAGNPDGNFDRLADVGTATQTGYRASIMAAMRFVDDHDGNLAVNPTTGVPGLIDFGRILDFMPQAPHVDEVVSRLQRSFFTYKASGTDAWKDPKITGAFFSGVDKGLEFLKTLKEKDIVEMLKAAGYEGEELKKQAALVIESIRVTDLAAVRAADDLRIKQNLWLAPRSDMPPIPGAAGATDWLLGLGQNPPVAGPPQLFPNAQAPGVTDWMLGLGGTAAANPTFKAPSNPLKPLALGLLGGSTGAAGALILDPDLSSLKITTQPPKPKSKGGSGRGSMLALSRGGIVPNYFAAGGYAIGTDTVPAMLTPGEFVMSKYAVDKYGVDNMKSINSGSSVGDSVYNYNLNLNVKSDANPDEIARAVMVQIKSVDAQRIRGARL